MPPLVCARWTTSAIPIVGCYYDLEALENDGLIVGTGWFEIKKGKGKYVAFTELRNDGGRRVRLKVKHLVVNKAKKKRIWSRFAFRW